MNRILLISSIVIAVIIGFALSVHSEHSNPYGIDDKCYELYTKILKKKNSERLPLLDSLMNLSQRLGDKKAITLTANLQSRYWREQRNEAKVIEAFNTGHQNAFAINYEEGYVKAYEELLYYYYITNNDKQAIIVAEKLKLDATEENSYYGLWLAHYYLGISYRNLKQLNLEKEHLYKAIEYYEQIPSHIKRPSTSEAFALLISMKARISDVNDLYAQGLQMAINHKDSIRIIRAHSRRLLISGDTAGFLKDYAILKSDPRLEESLSSSELMNTKAHYYVATNQLDSAYAQFNGMKRDRFYYSYIVTIAMLANDWKTAYNYHKQYDKIIEAEEDSVIDISTSRVSVMLGNDKLILKTQQDNEATLAAQKAEQQALAEQTMAEAKRQEAESQEKLLVAENARQMANNALLEMQASQMKDEARQAELLSNKAKLESSLAEQRESEAQEEMRHNVLQTIAILGVILLVLFVLWNIQNRITIRKLDKKSQQLVKARDIATRTSKVKDIFINNISIEIRDPLNGVLGITQALTTPGVEFSDDEKMEYGTLITEKVNMLTSMIDDILNVSDIQSGNFELTTKPVDIEQLCKSAISLIEYRADANVSLQFVNNLPPQYNALLDQRRVQQVLVSLLSNSCRYCKQGLITLEATLDNKPDNLSLIVTNSSTNQKLNEIEETLNGTHDNSETDDATIAGLTICANVAKKMNASVWVDRAYTSGVRIGIDIPPQNES